MNIQYEEEQDGANWPREFQPEGSVDLQPKVADNFEQYNPYVSCKYPNNNF